MYVFNLVLISGEEMFQAKSTEICGNNTGKYIWKIYTGNFYDFGPGLSISAVSFSQISRHTRLAICYSSELSTIQKTVLSKNEPLSKFVL